MTTGDCVFCRIRDRQFPGQFVYEDDDVFAIKDIRPLAPVHVLVIPKEHIPTVQDLRPDQFPLMGRLASVANQVAREQGVAESGYRLMVNAGPDALLTVWHLHLHVLGGARLGSGV
jgi:histidine triad (HIT) family protein